MTAPASLRIPLFLTPELPCNYLPDRLARTAFVGSEVPMSAELYAALMRQGFRRSGSHVYRPHCAGCQACIPVRIPVADFRPSRSQRRNLAQNADLAVGWERPALAEDHYQLYERYISQRHADGEMYPPSRDQAEQFLLADWSATRLLTLRHDQQLLAVLVADVADDGLSAVYSFFAPEQTRRGLGVRAVLALIERARSAGLPYVYLGYYIADCRKMNYKADYQPQQHFRDGEWQTVRD
ncbi:arginyltransferase [Permianibacter sp. IMCC34836]|uniref:arginyltransferase n=1 Tax=Permianibacter fluminis TaxID=2738515 RepID=UPI00155512CD|nr:arginyltransferase [Permianibacter fluminis]NQD37828.1 arginyltransferase [Permianibacter fluminis]